MTMSDAEHAKYRLTKSAETLREAQALLKAGFTTGVVNRIYYACFYSVWALLLTEGYSSSKHSGVLSLFNRHWINTERLPKDMGRFYHAIFDRRQQGDYTALADFEPADLDVWLGRATVFVDSIKAWISENKGIDLS